MPRLAMTLIDVGWGDSLFLEFEDDAGSRSFGLIDSNDTANNRSSFIYLKRFFEREKLYETRDHMFDFVLLTHAHADHAQGLKAIISHFGTKRFWYPRSLEWGGTASLLAFANKTTKNLMGYARRSRKNILNHQAVDAGNLAPNINGTQLDFLWPAPNFIDPHNENENSVVLALKLGAVSFLLTGDAEEKAWKRIANRIPADTRVFKVPHHGSDNGFFDGSRKSLWLDDCPQNTMFAISSHVRPFSHPAPSVEKALKSRDVYRTDQHYHITFETDGSSVKVKYSHW
ncbi:MBL fold metallo-hydrolase [Maridesulfovibrio sp.]|uniref:ComEC/Rec2 family competence protein n=1 Tax=Maridesulfovibrio sp. TaxID=2795000 RepID=UPI0029CA31EC|nr:MBL fold metallo-hydrolase [Maridesulfovibrio sp.]